MLHGDVVPSPVRIPAAGVAVLVHRGVPIGHWAVAAWEPQRFLPPYAEQFIDEVVAHCQRDYPGRAHVRRAPALPKPTQFKPTHVAESSRRDAPAKSPTNRQS